MSSETTNPVTAERRLVTARVFAPMAGINTARAYDSRAAGW